jgi:hypothetical protein
MTLTTNGHRFPTTDSADARMRVRAPENRPPAPDRPGSAPGFAHVRAIQDNTSKVKSAKPGKIRNFVQLHGGEAGQAIKDGWFVTESPEPLGALATTVFPTKEEAPTVLGWVGITAARAFRLTVHALAYLMCAATRTDKRAATSAALTLLAITASLAIAALAGH